MALKQTAGVVLTSCGTGLACWGITPTVGMTVGGLVLAVLSAAFLIDLDEEREP